jgi:hypothetical protein
MHHLYANRILSQPMNVLLAQMWKREQQRTEGKDENDRMKLRGNRATRNTRNPLFSFDISIE